MDPLPDLWTWIVANKTWVFGGCGITSIGAIVKWLFGRRARTESRVDTSQQQGGSGNVQVVAEHATIIQGETSASPRQVDKCNDGGNPPQLPKPDKEDSEPKPEKGNEEPLSMLEHSILLVFAVLAEETSRADVAAAEKQIIVDLKQDPLLKDPSVVSIKDALIKLVQRNFLEPTRRPGLPPGRRGRFAAVGS